MGITLSGRSDLSEIHTVLSVPGTLKHDSETFAKSRLWVLEDRTVIVVAPGEGREVRRIQLGLVDAMLQESRRSHVLALRDGTTLTTEEASCTCGMGAVASAGPVPGRWRIVRVRRPDWYLEKR